MSLDGQIELHLKGADGMDGGVVVLDRYSNWLFPLLHYENLESESVISNAEIDE